MNLEEHLPKVVRAVAQHEYDELGPSALSLLESTTELCVDCCHSLIKLAVVEELVKFNEISRIVSVAPLGLKLLSVEERIRYINFFNFRENVIKAHGKWPVRYSDTTETYGLYLERTQFKLRFDGPPVIVQIWSID